jgi:lysine 2,3-aminomutase
VISASPNPAPMTARTATTLESLSALTGMDLEALEPARPVIDRYALAVTPAMGTLIRAGSAGIASQFLPDPRELDHDPAERADPIDDALFSPLPGVVHRYRDRVLLKVVSACPVYCRFCFRREMVGPSGEAMNGPDLDAALDYIARDRAITEVILTGGDPFMLSPRRIEALMDRLSHIEHVELVRWHTRVPMVDPMRVNPALVAAIAGARQTVWVAVHANHPDEFTTEAAVALARLAHAGIGLVSQSVLLAGVNDDIDTLSALMRAFLRHRVKPYYLHHPDLAPGTAHFRLPVARGQALVAQLREQLTGLAQPTYVLDVPGAAFKAPLQQAHVRESRDGLEVLGTGGHWYPHHDS